MGVDLSLRNTGLSIYTAAGIHHRCATITYPLVREKKTDPPIPQVELIRRLISIANDVIGFIKTYRIRHVGIEGFAHGAKWQAHQIGEVAGVVKTQLWMSCGIVPHIVPPSSARKHVMGYGRPSKTDIVEVVEQGLGVVVENDHEADATIVARYTFDKVAAEEREADEPGR